MGDTATNAETDHDHAPGGGIVTTIALSVHSLPLGPVGRAALRDSAGAGDATLRSVIATHLGAGMAREWDDAPGRDALHGPHVPGYVAVRTRLRTLFAALPL